VERLTVILDACVLINILASGEFDGITGSKTRAFAVCSKVREESIFLRPDDPGILALEAISVDEYVDSGRLRILVLDGEEEETLYVNYAAELDDGEAMSMALAESRELVLATDDRKARRLFVENVDAPHRLLSTAELLRDWVDSHGVSPDRLKSALHRIMNRARYTPNRSDSNFMWWLNAAR
jgi:predicted nucleic acid-binding protein